MQDVLSPPAAALQNNEIQAQDVAGLSQPYAATNPEPANRRVRRDLLSVHIFLIVISGTIGNGLFENSGEVLAIAGPGGGITAFAAVGVGVIMVMEGIAEMVTHWPISNAMMEFVRVFIDKELAIVIGIAYAYAYSISFTILIIAASDLASHWVWSTTLQDIVFIALAPLGLLSLNCFGVLWYGNVEAFCGVLKVALVLMAFLTMCIINHLELQPGDNTTKFIDQGFQNNPAVANSPGIATLIAFPIAAYAYLGVEIVAVTAVEAKTPQSSLGAPARNIAWITTLMYVTSVVAYYFNVSWQDPKLPAYLGRLSTAEADYQLNSGTEPPPSSSVVIIAVLNSNKVVLSNVLTGLLITAVLSAANTALYVSSRTLWGLACQLDHQLSRSRYMFWRALSKLSTTTPRARVPGWALLVSASSFWWLLPFLRFTETSTAVNVVEIMSGAATNAVVLVWASQCVAFIRYRGWLKEFQNDLIDDYAQYDHINNSAASISFGSGLGWMQRGPAWIGLVFCFVTAIIFSTSSWWDGYKSPVDIVSAFVGVSLFPTVLTQIVRLTLWYASRTFIALFIFWLLLKLWRFVRGDDFEWCVSIRSWNTLRAKLDGLTNAIHSQDYDYRPQPGVPMDNLQPPRQGYVVDQPVAVGNSNIQPNGEERQGLGISQAQQYGVGESSGHVGPLPAERMSPDYGQRTQDGEAYGPRPNVQWSLPAPGGSTQQSPRRRNILENTRRS